MSKNKAIVMAVTEQGLTKAEAARAYGVTWRWVHTLLARYDAEGLAGIEPRSKRPKTNSRGLSDDLKAQIVQLRTQLTADGLDAGD